MTLCPVPLTDLAALGGLPAVNLYLHRADDGALWTLVRGDGVTKTQPGVTTDLIALIKSLPKGGDRIVRVIDYHPANTELLLRLYEFAKAGHLDSLQVCSPICLPPHVRQESVEDLLWQLACWIPLRSALGGWHEYGESDNLTRQMALADDDTLPALLAQHPIAPALRFLTTLDVAACGRLLGVLRDPRWYVDPGKPHGVSKLTSYLGLMPRTQRGVSGKSKQVRGHERCALVLRAWQGAGLPTDWESAPGAYFWRVWDQYGRDWKAEMQTSRRFIRFLRDVWLQTLYQDQQEVCAPGDFFSDSLVASAFREHCVLLDRPLFSVQD